MHHDQQHALGAGLAAPEQLSRLASDCLAPLGAAGAAEGLIEPQKNEAPGVKAEGIEGQREADSQDSEAGPPNDQAANDRKVFETLRAHLALKGFGLQALPSGGYLITRWDRSLHCVDLACVRSFMVRTGDAS